MSLHIAAKKDEIAKTVLLPGDPQRAKFIAENFLEKAFCYTDIRGMYGFTGTYKGKRVSVQGTGMGCPSIGIYAYELIKDYHCENLIRIGTAGSFSYSCPLGHLLIAQAAAFDSGQMVQRFKNLINYAPVANFDLLERAVAKAKQHGVSYTVGSTFTTDYFYDENSDYKYAKAKEYGVNVTDMETSELYTLAAKHNVKALSLLTVSDLCFGTFDSASAEERRTAYKDMITIALECVR